MIFQDLAPSPSHAWKRPGRINKKTTLNCEATVPLYGRLRCPFQTLVPTPNERERRRYASMIASHVQSVSLVVRLRLRMLAIVPALVGGEQSCHFGSCTLLVCFAQQTGVRYLPSVIQRGKSRHNLFVFAHPWDLESSL
jgi:hypothetical protein